MTSISAPNLQGEMMSARATRPIRVLLLLTSTAGGVGQHALWLAERLARDKFELTVAFGPGYPLDDSFLKLNCDIVLLSTKRSLSPVANLRGLWQVRRLMAQRQFDIVCTQQSIAGLVGRLMGSLMHVPVRLHCIHVYACHEYHPRVKRWVYRLIERSLDRFTTHYVAVSEATKSYGVQQKIFAPDRTTVIYNGVPDCQMTDLARAETRQELGITPEEGMVLAAGRFEAQKGLEYLIRAAALVREKLPVTRFVIVGEGPLRKSLEAKVQSLNLGQMVLFTGWRNDMPRLFAAADIFALPSLWEALPLTIAEAMAAGRAVVATDVGGVREMVQDQVSGRIVRPRDVPQLAAALTELLQDEAQRTRYGNAGRQRYLDRFTLPRMITQYEDLLEKLAG